MEEGQQRVAVLEADEVDPVGDAEVRRAPGQERLQRPLAGQHQPEPRPVLEPREGVEQPGQALPVAKAAT